MLFSHIFVSEICKKITKKLLTCMFSFGIITPVIKKGDYSMFTMNTLIVISIISILMVIRLVEGEFEL